MMKSIHLSFEKPLLSHLIKLMRFLHHLTFDITDRAICTDAIASKYFFSSHFFGEYFCPINLRSLQLMLELSDVEQ